MRFGLQWFSTDQTIPPQIVAPLVEQRGFESFFVTDHTHIPVSRQSPAPDGSPTLASEYSRTLDPFVALTAAALSTKELKVGTGVLLIGQRDPLTAAKALASIDFLAPGRLLVGVGAGWNIEEMRHHGVKAGDRFEIVSEHVEAMRTLWSRDEAEFHGKFVDFDRSWSWPKPTYLPPILVAGNGPRVLERVLKFGDEWAPGDQGEDTMMPRLQTLRRDCDLIGRAPIPTTMFVAPKDPSVLSRYEAAGVHRAVYTLPSLPAKGDLERELDKLARLVESYDSQRQHSP